MPSLLRPLWPTRSLAVTLAFCLAIVSVHAQGGPASPSGPKAPSPSPEYGTKAPDADGSGGSAGGPGSGSGAGGGYGSLDERDQAAERARFFAWLSSSPEGLRLAEYRAGLEALAAASIAAGVPADAYKLRIKEAAAKGVAPSIVMAALREDARLWDALGAALRDTGWPPAAKAADLYIVSATSLRNGLAFSAVLELLDWAAPARAQSERIGAVLKALTVIAASLPLDAGEAGRAALALAQSRLPVGQFDELTALARAAAARSVPPGEFASALIDALRRAKPLEELSRKFSL